MVKDIKLIELRFKELIQNEVNIELKKASFDQFNLLLGDNAQGKSRVFHFLRFLKDVHTGAKVGFLNKEKTIGHLIFSCDSSLIQYEFSVGPLPDGTTPIFDETLIRDGITLFSRSQKILLDESSNTQISNFFIPPNIPALTSFNSEKQFPTLMAVKSFLERMMFLEANRLDSSNIEISRGSAILNYKGRNASSVLETWKNLIPSSYSEVVTEFEETFPSVEKSSLKVEDRVVPGINIPAPLMFFKEKANSREILQMNWSDGMLRTICLIMLPTMRFLNPTGGFARPSLIFVDEIENGLDFNTLSHIVGFYESYSSHMQVVISSHSPTICNLISPEKWRITKRNGSHIEIFSPKDIEGDLEEQRKKLLKDNWEFYRRHIAKSKLYSVN